MANDAITLPLIPISPLKSELSLLLSPLPNGNGPFRRYLITYKQALLLHFNLFMRQWIRRVLLMATCVLILVQQSDFRTVNLLKI